MQVILTHENADFDAIASLLAAHKLYPGAQPILPHRVNRNVQAFLSLYGPGLPLLDPDALPRGQHVQRVILVDTQKLTFVRGMGKEIDHVLVIDHHTPPESILAGWQFQCEPLGAATTMLVEAISTRLIPISPVEATLMLAGIYEDTGSLTYASTTPRDLRAASWLIEQGADLEVATEFLEHPLTSAQQRIYQGLRDHMETVEIDGHPIVISWAKSPPETEEEVSTLAHKLRNLLEPSALFIFVQIGENTQMVARSATDDINVADVADHFGGGGHDRAAAALIRQRAAEDAASELREILPDHVKPRIKVRDLMSYGVRTVHPEDSIENVSQQMLQTGHEGFPVLDDEGRIVGLITRNAVDRALQHQLGQQPVRRIMQPGTVTVSPGDSVEYVRALMIQTGWGQIPVARDGRIIGVVTRTDMIRLQPSPQTAERQKIAHLMEQAIPGPVLALIHEIGAEAADAGCVIYFVGGIVRDLLLGQDIFDIDLV
ncbi:MAG: CBS domain-containing protein, partial [Anaerolineae bacterium]